MTENVCIYCDQINENVVLNSPCVSNRKHSGVLIVFGQQLIYNCCGEPFESEEICSYGPHVFRTRNPYF